MTATGKKRIQTPEGAKILVTAVYVGFLVLMMLSSSFRQSLEEHWMTTPILVAAFVLTIVLHEASHALVYVLEDVPVANIRLQLLLPSVSVTYPVYINTLRWALVAPLLLAVLLSVLAVWFLVDPPKVPWAYWPVTVAVAVSLFGAGSDLWWLAVLRKYPRSTMLRICGDYADVVEVSEGTAET